VIHSAAGGFHRYDITPTVVKGKFYIGYQQLEQEKTFMGYDVNFNNQSRVWLKQVGGTWFNSIFEGTLLLRADFGDGTEPPLSNPIIETQEQEVSFYPNPAQSEIYFTQLDVNQITIYGLNGQIVMQQINPGQSISITNLNPGFYLVRINDQASRKLIISK
jgi:hypothetical protein